MLLIILFLCLNFSHHTNIETHYLVIIYSYRVRASEPQVDSREKPIVGSKVNLFLEIDRYSCDEVLSDTVPIPSMN